ncbi:transcription antitermination factor NusB [Paenibacillus chitinolyticus]|uniref:Transcription antitermination protein NusB n=1 Tax=Paenibacillus chitinolyticus TaxID=79263 RepID=A0A410WUZ1_9BACL|nr:MULTISPECIES: transcription antitermination factor NusB [Paenibacillus]MCY9589488.1 transcription antitermination factor NusB [Paenibacillus chitinolyticus]MCY9599234.1 transcription antitermination factor NusB [Paenibacillus chitinolyticus]QAV18195.1 transcription antitermination factor NusB [Paenibacillus chitinolyticus]GKS11941.1 N utilization substance protein B [Paenibacillus chitinolyticus]
MRRRVAREIALQSLYQIDMNGVSAAEAVNVAVHEAENDNEAQVDHKEKIMPEYIRELVDGTLNNRDRIDQLLAGYLKGWKMDRLSRVDREVLRLAAFEMLFQEDVPPKVVVNEAIDLAKHFGTDDSGKFVNGVLGKMIKDVDTLREHIRSGKE